MDHGTLKTLEVNRRWGSHTPFCKAAIIRGIGYRAFFVTNRLTDDRLLGREFVYQKYLIIRAGHTTDLYSGVRPGIFIKTLKKDRKLVVYGKHKSMVCSFIKRVAQYREPSVYTGRGVRLKKVWVARKAGKKDKQKGKSF